MKPKSEELLPTASLWSADMLLRPTFPQPYRFLRKLGLPQRGLLRQIGILEKQQLVERDPAWQ